MSEEPPPPKRVRLNREDFDSLSKEDLFRKWSQQESYLATLETKFSDSSEELSGLRESEEKLKHQQIEAARRENILVMRLTTKEQEMQECATQIAELKQAQTQSTSQLRSLLLDPAINLLFQRMKREMDATKEKLEQTQNDLAAWKFTPDSQTGKRLMAKCRMLLTENEELGKVISSGRMAKLEGEIALEKTLVQEMKKSQEETDEFLVELDEDQEGMQTTIFLLQQQLKDCKTQLQQLQDHNQQLQQAAAPAAPSASPSAAAVTSSRTAHQMTTDHRDDTPAVTSAVTSEVFSNQSYDHYPNHTHTVASVKLEGASGGVAIKQEEGEAPPRTAGLPPPLSAPEPDFYSPSSPSPTAMETSDDALNQVVRTAVSPEHNNHHHSNYTTTTVAMHKNSNNHQQQQHNHSPASQDADARELRHMHSNETNGEDPISEEMAEDSQTPDLEMESCEETTAEEESEESEETLPPVSSSTATQEANSTSATYTTNNNNSSNSVVVNNSSSASHTNYKHNSSNSQRGSASPVSTSAGGGSIVSGGGGAQVESTDASSDAWSPPPASAASSVNKHTMETEEEDENSSDPMVSDQSNHANQDKARPPPQILPNGLDDIPQSTSEDET